MLYVYYGNDAVRIREAAHKKILELNAGSDEVVEISAETYEEGMVTDILESESLFGGVKLVRIDRPSGEPKLFAECVDCLQTLADSVHHFVLIEETLNAAQKKKFTAVTKECYEYSAETGGAFNSFSLTDALVARDKKRVWILLNEAWQHNLSPEEVVGLLFWQVKTLRIVAKSKNSEHTGLKPFVYQKAKAALRNFKIEEIDQMSRILVRMYHDAHLGKVDMKQALEKWVLQL